MAMQRGDGNAREAVLETELAGLIPSPPVRVAVLGDRHGVAGRGRRGDEGLLLLGAEE